MVPSLAFSSFLVSFPSSSQIVICKVCNNTRRTLEQSDKHRDSCCKSPTDLQSRRLHPSCRRLCASTTTTRRLWARSEVREAGAVGRLRMPHAQLFLQNLFTESCNPFVFGLVKRQCHISDNLQKLKFFLTTRAAFLAFRSRGFSSSSYTGCVSLIKVMKWFDEILTLFRTSCFVRKEGLTMQQFWELHIFLLHCTLPLPLLPFVHSSSTS